jgi:hypothetical protein
VPSNEGKWRQPFAPMTVTAHNKSSSTAVQCCCLHEHESPVHLKEPSLKPLFSEVWLYDSFDDELFAAYHESMRNCEQKKEVDSDTEEIKSEDVVAVTVDEEKRAEEPTDIIKECRFWGRAPCHVHDIYAEMMCVAAGMEGEVEDKKKIRHALILLLLRSFLDDSVKVLGSRFLITLLSRFTMRILKRTRMAMLDSKRPATMTSNADDKQFQRMKVGSL